VNMQDRGTATTSSSPHPAQLTYGDMASKYTDNGFYANTETKFSPPEDSK